MKLLLLPLFLILTACAGPYVFNPNVPNHNQNKLIGVFLDGTQNDPIDDTNVQRLRNLAYLQSNPRIHTIYINGVGTEGGLLKRLWGSASGSGFTEDVKNAYIYIGNTYRTKNDKVLIFGFSRGSYSARVLAGLLAVGGVPDFSNIDDLNISEEDKLERKEELIQKVFDAYTGNKSLEKRRSDVLNVSGYKQRITGEDFKISFMGLWDTVPAIGLPDFGADTLPMTDRRPNEYYDQICNIEKAAHAASVDDNRARVFDFLSLTYNQLTVDCGEEFSIDEVVNEVWFSGAHSDVGGGYNTDLSGVSLNWMIGEVENSVPEFLPDNSQVYQCPFGESHIASNLLFGLNIGVFGNRNRSFMHYAALEDYNLGKVKIHQSVFDRLLEIPKKGLEYCWSSPTNNPPDFTEIEKLTENFSHPKTYCVNRIVYDETQNDFELLDEHSIECLPNDENTFKPANSQICFDIVDLDYASSGYLCEPPLK